MQWTDQMHNSHSCAIDVMLVCFPHSDYTAKAAYWDLTTFSEAASTTHRFITSDGIVTTIIMPELKPDYTEETPRTFLSFWAQVTATTGALLLNQAFTVRDPLESENDPTILSARDLFADALAAARAGALPGLEALYLAQAAQAREAAEYNERERRARIELAMTERRTVGDLLARFGIAGITAESCAIGRWESDESATWCHAGAAISFAAGSRRIYVAVDEDIENRRQNWMHLPDEIRPVDKANLLSMIQQAAEWTRIAAEAKQLAETPLELLPIKPFYLVKWFSGHDEEIQAWANKQWLEGYGNLTLAPGYAGLFATVNLLLDEE